MPRRQFQPAYQRRVLAVGCHLGDCRIEPVALIEGEQHGLKVGVVGELDTALGEVLSPVTTSRGCRSRPGCRSRRRRGVAEAWTVWTRQGSS